MSLARSAFWSFLTRVVCAILGFGISILAARGLGPEYKGVYSFWCLMIGWAAIAASFGLESSTISLFGEKLSSGGLLGLFASRFLLQGFSTTGSYIITGTAITIALMLLTPLSPSVALAALRRWYGRLKEQIELLVNLYRARAKKAKEAKRKEL